jgi:branched-chain amino acid transport system ATP-binding protein
MAKPEALLAVRDLNGYYGTAHVLQDVSFEIGAEPTAIIGRNGMGKSTLCLALMGLLPSARGSVRFEGQELLGKPSYKIAAAGLGLVPQGRRLFPSLTTEEHLRLVSGKGKGKGNGNGDGDGWTTERVYELFPRLADRKRVGGMELSGGEQQMLAIARTLLLDPKLLIMDEPSEGLAPALIDQLLEAIKSLSKEGTAVLVVEQNLGVASELADRQLVMIAGRIAAETTAKELENDPDAQRRYLGVEPLTSEE